MVNNRDCYWSYEENQICMCCFDKDRVVPCSLEKICRYYVPCDKTDEYIHSLLKKIEVLKLIRVELP